MSAMVISIKRSPSVRAGLFGAIVGATLALGIVVVIAAVANRAEPTGGVQTVSGPAAVLDVNAALRAHLAREYGRSSGGADLQAALQRHLAIEYGSAEPVGIATASLQRHLAIEYGEAGNVTGIDTELQRHLALEYGPVSTGLNVQSPLQEHLQAEYGAP